ncbi:MAG: helicase-related protein [Planctomycetota bacterium]|nr:helicase-related protein [Planctomycetota bacterium]
MLAVANKKQAAILVPTEVLARQHFESINEFLKGSRVRTDLVVGSMNSAERAAAHRFLARGETDIVVGTHALLTADVNFARLGLAVVDEQHRFGVAQRAGLKYKGTATDTLVMTATPIPRTLAMTLFGDLDVSVIDELPPGRKPVRTLRFPLEEERKAIALIREELSNGGQAFVISPYIEATATDDFRSALATYERFGEKIFADYSVGLVHGRMPPAKREMEMERFRRGETDVLISTVIVEVGIDMPNASVMFIQHAERFGLSTLHQLRGRVGRGKRISYCLCTADLTNDQSRERLEVFCSTTDGFRIAEEDLRLRGPGEVLGTKQHGLPALKWGSFPDDYDVLKLARTEAFRLVESGWRPPDHLRAEMQRCTPSNPNYSTVG